MNCWRCNGTGWYGGVDGNHFECNHPPDTREYTDKGYLIMGIVNKYDEALEKLELLRLRASSHVDISNCKKTMQDWIDSDAEFIKESLTKAKAFDDLVARVRQHEKDGTVYTETIIKEGLNPYDTLFLFTNFNKAILQHLIVACGCTNEEADALRANLTEKYIKE